MKSKRLASSIVALSFVAAMGFGYSWFVRKRPTASPIGATTPSASVSAKAEAPTMTLSKDVCEKAADRCACAADHGAQLLGASFAERALQLTSRAAASCTGSAFLAVRAEALAAVERAEEASKVATVVLQSDPQNRFARRALAIVAMQSKDFGTSDIAFAKLLEEDPKDMDSLFYEALSQRKRDHYNRAREGFLHVLRLNAQHIDARYNLVTLTAAAGAAQEAEHDYQELLQIAPVGDARLVAARAALNHSGSAAPTELPIVHRASSAASVAPSP